jgi:heat shock transcription factor
MVTDNNGMMSVINAANNASPQNTGPNFDFDSALHHFQNRDGNTPLTQQQRNDMLSMMNNLNNPTGGSSTANSALTHPQTPPLPSLNQISANNDQLEHLQRLATEHSENVQNLRDRITSLSPSGFIPGFENGTNAPPDFDLDDWFQSDGGGDPNFENLNFGDIADTGDGFGDMGMPDQAAVPDLLNENDAKYAGGRVESISSRGTSPASPVEALMGEGDLNSPRKRRRGN